MGNQGSSWEWRKRFEWEYDGKFDDDSCEWDWLGKTLVDGDDGYEWE